VGDSSVGGSHCGTLLSQSVIVCLCFERLGVCEVVFGSLGGHGVVYLLVGSLLFPP
jgi:hypothetical protein